MVNNELSDYSYEDLDMKESDLELSEISEK